jgi:hypothetical protein
VQAELIKRVTRSRPRPRSREGSTLAGNALNLLGRVERARTRAKHVG